MEDDVVPFLAGKTAVIEAELECYRGQIASSAEFDACFENCFYIVKIIDVEVFAVQGLSGCIYQSLASLVPGMFVHGSPEVMFAPFVRLCSRLRANGWISEGLNDRVPLQFLTLVLPLRSTNIDVDLLEEELVVQCGLIKERLASELRGFLSLLVTMGDSFLHLQNASQLTLFTLWDRWLRICMFADESFFSGIKCVRSVTILMTVWFVLLDKFWREWTISLWLMVRSRKVMWGGGEDWFSICKAWLCNLDWNELIVSNDEKAPCREIGASWTKMMDSFVDVSRRTVPATTSWVSDLEVFRKLWTLRQ